MPGNSLSDTENILKKEWLKNPNRPVLRAITIDGGLRAFKDKTRIEFQYPIVAIAGQNGTGKSTILAVAAAAYRQHKGLTTFIPPRKTEKDSPNYALGDFFVGSKKDGFFEGVSIGWEYFGHNTRDSFSITKKGDKWIRNDQRPTRSVAYLGLDRVLPAIDLRALRNIFGGYNVIQQTPFSGDQLELTRSIGGVYEQGERSQSGSYRLYSLSRYGSSYTSFHMGVGEEIMCKITDWLTIIPEETLLLIEELEVGCHPEFQISMVEVLKEQANKRRLQIILTTHSSSILDALPMEGRVFLRRDNKGRIQVDYGVSTTYAMSQLSGKDIPELMVYVEDTVAQKMVSEVLSTSTRKRIKILSVGSKTVVARQLAAHRLNPELGNAVAVMDGDVPIQEFTKNFRSQLGREMSDKDKCWFAQHWTRLPGSNCPEQYLWEKINLEKVQKVMSEIGNIEIPDIISARTAQHPKNWHDIPYRLAKAWGLDEETVIIKLISSVVKITHQDFNSVVETVEKQLNAKILPSPEKQKD